MNAQLQTVEPLNDGNALIVAIGNAAMNPLVYAEKMERLLAIYERTQATQARQEYAKAFAEMQLELPAIGERGNAAGRYTYALWEDINTKIKPVMAKNGFALSFRTDTSERVTVTGVLSHIGGHEVDTSITMPADASGNKNAVQAVASAVSYGKRYVAGALLNLTYHGEDDDAYKAVDPLAQKNADWLAALESVGTYPEYLELKAKMVVDYPNGKPPKEVQNAFGKVMKSLKPKDEE